MAEHTLGMAADFYRVRVLRLDEEDAPDLEWREDILYRDPPAQTVSERACWIVQAVDITDDEHTNRLAAFEELEDARAFVEAAEEDLPDLTRAEFEARYFPSADC